MAGQEQDVCVEVAAGALALDLESDYNSSAGTIAATRARWRESSNRPTADPPLPTSRATGATFTSWVGACVTRFDDAAGHAVGHEAACRCGTGIGIRATIKIRIWGRVGPR